jgi:membrane-bound metal-dependent hydrolase YbcI (DUF457 family)
MILAHLPAGYLLSALSYQRFKPSGVVRSLYLSAGMFGAVAPDLDMIYFYGFDHRAHPHHSYFSHFPITWLILLIFALIWLKNADRKNAALLMTVFAANGLLHMLLDYCASNIYWLAPFVMKPFSLLTVDRLYEPWWLNFLLHRSFLLEIAIIVWAVCLGRRNRNPVFRSGDKLIERGVEEVVSPAPAFQES